MSWLRLDDRFPEHPKVLPVGALGLAVHVRALCYAARNLTDGFIPTAVVPSFTADFRGEARSRVPASLVSAGLWEETEGGFLIHDYLDFNPSREKVEAERQSNKGRVTRWRKGHAGHRNAEGNDDVTPLQTPMKRECNAGPVPLPVPLPITREKREPRERGRFAPPTLAEVQAYLAEIGAGFTAQRFVDHHEETGWRWGKPPGRPIKDWRRTARTWKARDDERGTSAPAPRALVGAHPSESRPHPAPVTPEVALDPPPPGGGVWPQVLEALRPLVDERDFDTWFRPTQQVGELNGSLRVAVAPLFRRYVPAEYGGAIEAACRSCGVAVPVEFLTDEAGGEA